MSVFAASVGGPGSLDGKEAESREALVWCCERWFWNESNEHNEGYYESCMNMF